MSWILKLLLLLVIVTGCSTEKEDRSKGFFKNEIFSLVNEHAHGATIVELPNGDVLAAWFQGSGERWADDVAILGARLRVGDSAWSKPFVMADVPEFPDINPVLFLDHKKQLWLVWYTVIANQWETSLPTYRISDDFMQKDEPPNWKWQEVLFVKPGDKAERGILPDDKFVLSVEQKIDEYSALLIEGTGKNEILQKRFEWWKKELIAKAKGADMMKKGYYTDSDGNRVDTLMGYPYFRRMGWQTKNKAVVLEDGRIVLPLYSDGFSFSLMAITDDQGDHWQFSEPLVAPGNIQPAISIKMDGSLVTYMRDNGPAPKRLHISESLDGGITWSTVRDSQVPNSGAGADVVTLANGHWVMANNDTERGRHRLAISLTEDEGKSWPYTRYLELDEREEQATQSAYPSIIEGLDGMIHVVYSNHRRDQGEGPNENIKYARFIEEWIRE